MSIYAPETGAVYCTEQFRQLAAEGVVYRAELKSTACCHSISGFLGTLISMRLF
jgi:hypothetical protein